ncbi:Hypothetical protein D9617_18g033100 [Elsinoe fawcettii]|nr:Hypothetical protein D9617_18g033100 [Elsinoe fawcettii]
MPPNKRKRSDENSAAQPRKKTHLDPIHEVLDNTFLLELILANVPLPTLLKAAPLVNKVWNHTIQHGPSIKKITFHGCQLTQPVQPAVQYAPLALPTVFRPGHPPPTWHQIHVVSNHVQQTPRPTHNHTSVSSMLLKSGEFASLPPVLYTSTRYMETTSHVREPVKHLAFRTKGPVWSMLLARKRKLCSSFMGSLVCQPAKEKMIINTYHPGPDDDEYEFDVSFDMEVAGGITWGDVSQKFKQIRRKRGATFTAFVIKLPLGDDAGFLSYEYVNMGKPLQE